MIASHGFHPSFILHTVVSGIVVDTVCSYKDVRAFRVTIAIDVRGEIAGIINVNLLLGVLTLFEILAEDIVSTVIVGRVC